MTKQAEGFKLMKYATDGGYVEVIWNSRDGIAPFIIRSRDGQEMHHIDWSGDVFAPFHEPKLGDRIFVDLTYERALEGRRAYVERYWNSEIAGVRFLDCWEDDRAEGMDDATFKENIALTLAKSDMEAFAPHTPHLVVVTPEIQEQLRIDREKRRAAA